MEKSDLAVLSIAVVRKNPILLFFPVVSSIVSMIIFFLFLIVSDKIGVQFITEYSVENIISLLDGGLFAIESNLGLILLFIYYLVASVITVYFNSALVMYVYHILQGKAEAITIQNSFLAVDKKIKKLLIWAFIQSTLLFALKYLQKRSKNLLTSIFSFSLSILWSVVTYFMIPVLLFENLGPIQSMERSGKLFLKRWKVTFISTASVMVYIIPAIGIGIILMLAGIYLDSILLISLAILGLVLFSVSLSAIMTILNTALYLYAAKGKVGKYFSKKELQNAFVDLSKDSDTESPRSQKFRNEEFGY